MPEPGRVVQRRRVMRYRLAVPVILLLVLGFGAAAPAEAQSWKTVAKSRQRRGQDFLDVKINYAVGRFELKRGSDRLLYRLDSKYDEEAFKLTSSYLESKGRGSLRIDIEGHEEVDLKDLKDYDFEAGNLSVDLTGATPVVLAMKFGAAEARLDLGGLRLQNLVLETGASDTHIWFSETNRETAEHCSFKAGAAQFRVDNLGNSRCERITVSGGVGTLSLDFSGDWDHDATGDINVGLGTIEIAVPSELGVRVERSTFLMSFDAPGFEKHDGGVWLSQNWDTAKNHLTLSISGALGGIKIARL
jgi:hypothetical protein